MNTIENWLDEDNILENDILKDREINDLCIEIKKEIESLKEDVLGEINKLIDEILLEPSLSDKENKTIKDFVEAKKYGKAVWLAFLLLWKAVFRWFWDTWLKQFKYLEEKLWNIIWIEKQGLSDYINIFSQKLDTISDPNKKIKLTYIMSALQNELLSYQNPEKNYSKRELLKENIMNTKDGLQVWKVLLINKKQKKTNLTAKMWDKLLSEYNKTEDNELSFLHSVIISKIEWEKIYITHSTLRRLSDKKHKPGVEEISLDDLLDQYKWVDILVLNMPEQSKLDTLDYIVKVKNEQLNTKKSLYDKKAAISGWFPIIKKDDNKVNCVELIAKWIWDDKIKNITHPNEFLKSEIMKPVYLTSF